MANGNGKYPANRGEATLLTSWWPSLRNGLKPRPHPSSREYSGTLATPFPKTLKEALFPEQTLFHLFCPPEPTQDASAPPRVWDGLWYEPDHPIFQPLSTQNTPVNTTLSLDKESFTFALQQIYPCNQVLISGWGEPFRNPHWKEWLAACYAYTKPTTQLYSHADWEPHDMRGLWEQPLNHLTLQLVAHTPSAAMSMAQPTSLFSANKPLRLDWRTWQRRVKAVESLMASRPSHSKMFVEVALLIDAVTVFHIPDMITWAQQLGVDGICFENRYVISNNPDPLTLTSSPSESFSIFQELSSKKWPLAIQWPALAAPHKALNARCDFLSNTLSMAPDLSVNPCPQRLVQALTPVSIWDKDLLDNIALKQLQYQHSAEASPGELPWPCQTCLHRC